MKSNFDFARAFGSVSVSSLVIALVWTSNLMRGFLGYLALQLLKYLVMGRCFGAMAIALL